jgi:hypothetical protein
MAVRFVSRTHRMAALCCYTFLLEVESTPGSQCSSVSWIQKNQMTPSRIEPTTYVLYHSPSTNYSTVRFLRFILILSSTISFLQIFWQEIYVNCLYMSPSCYTVSVTDPHGRILGFLDRCRHFFFQVAPQLYSRGWVDPVPVPTTSQQIWWRRESNRDLWICSQELWRLDHSGGLSWFKEVTQFVRNRTVLFNAQLRTLYDIVLKFCWRFEIWTYPLTEENILC